MLWSAYSSHEYLKSPEEIVGDLRNASLAAGEIVLLHDAHKGTVEALPAILDLLEEKGLRSVTQAELCGRQVRPVPSSRKCQPSTV